MAWFSSSPSVERGVSILHLFPFPLSPLILLFLSSHPAAFTYRTAPLSVVIVQPAAAAMSMHSGAFLCISNDYSNPLIITSSVTFVMMKSCSTYK